MVNRMFVSVILCVMCLISFGIPYILHCAGRGRILDWKISTKPLF